MAEQGRVKSLRAVFEKNATKPSSPVEFEISKARIARHNLKYAARRASMIGAVPVGNTSKKRQEKTVTFELEAGSAFWLPELGEAIEIGDEKALNKSVLNFFFEEHDPGRLNEVDTLLETNAGREEAFFLELSVQYPEPSMGVAFAMVEAKEKVESQEDWAKFDEDKPILNGVRRPTGVWALNYSPWEQGKD